MAVTSGLIYAEAEINVDRAVSSVSKLEGAFDKLSSETLAGVAKAFDTLSVGLMDLEPGSAFGKLATDVLIQANPIIQSVAPIDVMDMTSALYAETLPVTIPVAITLTPESINITEGVDFVGPMTAAGAAAAQGFSAGIVSGAGSAVSCASTMVSGVLNAARSGVSGAQNIGAMISAGVASGISSGQSGVVNAAVAMVKAAVSAAKAAAEINSPSKITTEFGKFWDEGWAVGIRKNTRLVTGEAADMVADTIKAVGGFSGTLAPDLEGAIRSAVYVEPPAGVAYGAARQAAPTVRVTGPAIDYDALANAMNQRQVSLYMNDRRMAQVMAAETARAQNVRNRSIALGYGVRGRKY